jgi:hypothetical protein
MLYGQDFQIMPWLSIMLALEGQSAQVSTASQTANPIGAKGEREGGRFNTFGWHSHGMTLESALNSKGIDFHSGFSNLARSNGSESLNSQAPQSRMTLPPDTRSIEIGSIET